MKNLFLLNEEEKNRILKLHIKATKNQYKTKGLLSEGLADVFFGLVDGCSSVNKGENRFVDDNYLDVIVDDFKDAYGDTMGTDLDSYRAGIKKITEKLSYNDFCQFVDLYQNNAGESFKDATDSDIDYDSEWQEIIDAIKSSKTRNKQQAATTPPPSGGGQGGGQTSTQDAGQNTFDQALAKYPCLKNIATKKEVKQSGGYDYVEVKTRSGTKYNLYLNDGNLYDLTAGKFLNKYMGKDVPCNA